MSDGMTSVRVVVSGRVQGVWYRQGCRDVAVAAGVTGWVRNNADGTVEARLEGDHAAVEQVLVWMREGPRRAKVTQVRVTSEPASAAERFEVL